MSDANSPKFIVARYLQQHGYDQTLQAFLSETGLPDYATSTENGHWNLEQILREKSLYDENLNYEKDSTAVSNGWSSPCPEKATQPVDSNAANSLAVTADTAHKVIVASFVNNTMGMWNTLSPPQPARQGFIRGDRNILSIATAGEYLLTSKMDGYLDFHDFSSGCRLATLKAHTAYAVQIATTWDENRLIVATAGWDRKVSILCPSLDRLADARSLSALDPTTAISDRFTSHSAPQNVQSVLFVRHPDTNDLYLVYTIRDSIYLHYLLLSHATDQLTQQSTYTATPAGRQSLAPQQHSTWTSFTPSHIEACPTDPTLIAIATSHTPSMKLIITRLLFPDSSTGPASSPTGTVSYGTKDELAIRLVCNTLAPQNDYSTPRCAWRPDGSGLWVSGDDGVVRGIDAETGKVVRELKGHDHGTKVRCLCAGKLPDQSGNEREVLISGGFDKRLIVWEVA